MLNARLNLLKDLNVFCSIDGFAVPPSELLHRVLRDDEVLKVQSFSQAGLLDKHSFWQVVAVSTSPSPSVS